jgi:hypothetical protein
MHKSPLSPSFSPPRQQLLGYKGTSNADFTIVSMSIYYLSIYWILLMWHYIYWRKRGQKQETTSKIDVESTQKPAPRCGVVHRFPCEISGVCFRVPRSKSRYAPNPHDLAYPTDLLPTTIFNPNLWIRDESLNKVYLARQWCPWNPISVRSVVLWYLLQP